MADRRHHGKGEHDKRDVAIPSVPGSGLVVIEPERVLGGLETVLDRPATTLDPHQRLDRCSRRTPSGKKGEIAFGDTASDQSRASTNHGWMPVFSASRSANSR